MASGSVLKADFRVERSVDGDITIAVTTSPIKSGDLGLFATLVSGLFLTALLGSYNPEIRSSAGPTLLGFLVFFALAGVGYKVFIGWAARKTTGSLVYSASTRTLSNNGLEKLFPWRTMTLPVDSVLALDTVMIRGRTGRSSDSGRSQSLVRLWFLAARGKSPDEMQQLIECHRHDLAGQLFWSLDKATRPAGAVILGTAFENAVFRRVAAVLAESGVCTAYDATGLATTRLLDTPRKSAVIGAPVTFSIPTVSLPIKILAGLMGFVISTFIALFSLNPYVFVYILLLVFMALSTRQVLVCDDDGLHLHYRYFLGLWRRGHDDRRWDEITAIQIERHSNGFLALAIRRADGDDWALILPNERVGRHIEQQIKGLISPPSPFDTP